MLKHFEGLYPIALPFPTLETTLRSATWFLVLFQLLCILPSQVIYTNKKTLEPNTFVLLITCFLKSR